VTFLDDDEWTEGYDAHIPRVDLVGKAANGHPRFLLMKNDRGEGLIQPEEVAKLIAKAASKATTQGLVPMYSADGQLIGVVDPKNILPLGDAPGSKAPAPAAAPAAPAEVPAEQVAQDEAAEVAKMIRGLRLPAASSTALAKSAGTVHTRYMALMKALGPARADMVSSSVTRAALRLMFGPGQIPTATAMDLAKSVALDAAAAEARRPLPSIEAAAAAIRAAQSRPPTFRL
jgi:hypothetical protein